METVADQMLYSDELADTVYESSGSVHDSLEPIELVLWSTGQQTVTVVDPWDDKAIDYCLQTSVIVELSELNLLELVT